MFDVPRLIEALQFEGETVSRYRVARPTTTSGLQGIPQRRRWRAKPSGVRASQLRKYSELGFTTLEPNTKWGIDIVRVRTAEA
ncbi:hypothetical protein [Salinisphaera japonica]|uniref:Uncharacterized protein n=1 Tax=Salinisphaera japonica YTM-1 TaxID=1209778 RepID=A0A423PJI0_9GAMM|nr:hypothetical protein [Salinisphaera japonica]ROO25662.1 hypothetical protein SAJA_12670 [Salinisphaera japonica YTM-1]